ALATLCGPPRGGRIRRPDYDRTPVAIEHDLELLASSLHDHLREATSVAHEVAKDIIQVVLLESCRFWTSEEAFDRLGLSGWNLCRRELPMCSCADSDCPFLSR